MNIATITHRNIVKSLLETLGKSGDPDAFYTTTLNKDKFLVTHMNRDYDVVGVDKIDLNKLLGNSEIHMEGFSFDQISEPVSLASISGHTPKIIPDREIPDYNQFSVWFNKFIILSGITALERKDVDMSKDDNFVYIDIVRSPLFTGTIKLVIM